MRYLVHANPGQFFQDQASACYCWRFTANQQANVVKGIKDACNEIVWDDDSQVVRLVASKHYAERACAVVAVGVAEGNL
ncbi:RusA family crossover junction endodeoxyribonuclease [Collimonas arenae]|uniref:RusA family crossover junction endodeoxyribonuclease n=1 Tax=Collimonas arenae TaxID=279058 RepID=UPI003F5A0475